jgi:hypothetical protein
MAARGLGRRESGLSVRFRVKLSSGAVIMSRLNKSVPPVGHVAGGGESPYSAPRRDTEPAGVTEIGPGKIKEWDLGNSSSASAIYGAPARQRVRERNLSRSAGRPQLPALTLRRPSPVSQRVAFGPGVVETLGLDLVGGADVSGRGG